MHPMTSSMRRRGAASCLVVIALLAAALPACIAAQWQQYPTGGNTRCGHGDPYSVFWRAGTNDRVTIFFEGGGACWDAVSCLLPVWATKVMATPDSLDKETGLFGIGEQRSAVVNDTILHIPYCTGDVHAGEKFSDYSIAHYGRINVEAGLDFLQQKILPAVFPDGKQPAQVNVMGCSAGSLGALFNAPFVFKRFPNATHRVWGESEVGVVSGAQWAGVWNNWNIQLPPWIPALAPQFTKPYAVDVIAKILLQVATFYPEASWGLYTSNADVVQSGLYIAGGGNLFDWTQQMRNSLAELRAGSARIATYIGPGNGHCGVAESPNWYWTATSNGVLLYQWVNDLINGVPTLQASVDCMPNC